MRRASSSLLYRLIKPNLASQNVIPSFFRLSSQNTLLAKSPIPFPKCTHHRRSSIRTTSHSAPHLNTGDLLASLGSLNTTGEILGAFRSLDSCLKVDSFSHEELLKALDFAVGALEVLERDEGCSISVVRSLRLLGSISCKLKKFDDSLESLGTAVTILDRLAKEGFDDPEVKMVGLEVQLQLTETNSEMGRKWDALMSLRNVLELRKLIFDPNSREMGCSYYDLAEAYAVVSNFKEAWPLCLKALEVFEICYGRDSVEIARVRQLIGVIHAGLDENDKALEQNELARGIFSRLGLEAEHLDLEIEAANIKLSMGRSGEAIEILKVVIQKVGKESVSRAFVFVSMSKALCTQEKFGESKRCLEIACGVLDKLDHVSSSKVYETYAEVSMMYEMMNEFETALSLMKRTLEIVGRLPREQHLEGSISARMGWLLLLTGRADQAISYLERGERRLRDSFGQMHFGLGFVNKHLGQAYLEVNKPAQAVLVLGTAYNILCRWFGPYHEDSIEACQCLANAYAAKASFSPVATRQRHYVSAMDFQRRVIEAWERQCDTASDELREAHRLFEQLKRKAEGSPSAVFPANALPLSQCNDNGTTRNEEVWGQN